MKHAIFFILTMVVSAEAYAMRCHSRLISVGDTTLTLEKKCGPADFIHTRQVNATAGAVGNYTAGASTRVFETVETRIYTGDPGRLARFIDIRRGVITAIRPVKLLTVDDPVGCQKILESNDEIGKVRMTCGAPLDTAQWSEERAFIRNGLQVSEMVTYDRWFYDLGDGRFERILTFENGALIQVEAGRRQ